MRLKLVYALLMLIVLFLFAPAYSMTFDFDDGTTQGWTLQGLFSGDDAHLITPEGYLGTWQDLQNSPNAPPALDPLGNNIGSLGIDTFGNSPSDPSGFVFFDWVSPDLSGDSQWQNLARIEYDVTGVVGASLLADSSLPGAISVQSILNVTQPDGTEGLWAADPRVFDPIATNTDYADTSWTTYALDVEGLGLPAGSSGRSTPQGILYRTDDVGRYCLGR